MADFIPGDASMPPNVTDRFNEATGLEDSLRIARTVVPFCDNDTAVAKDTAKLTVLTGGITNKLYLLTVPAGGIVVRIFGDGTEKIIDRSRELLMCSYLSKFSVGPKVYCTFENGRLEEYFPARAVLPEEMRTPPVYRLTASKLAAMHKIPIKEGSKAEITTTVREWYKLACQVKLPNNADGQAKLDSLKLESLGPELDLIDTIVANSKSPLVMSHNDLLCGNILVNHDLSSVYFVDFEYGSVNPSSFDIANHINEWPGCDAQVERDWKTFPTASVVSDIVKCYLEAGSGADPDTELVEQWSKEVLEMTLVSHVFWGLWSVIQAGMSDIDFDYPAYAVSRLGEFHAQKSTRLLPH